MASADELVRNLGLLDPDDYPTRDSLIRDLVVRFAWPATIAASFFGLTDRQVRRIAGPGRGAGRPVAVLPGEAPGLTRREIPMLTLEEARRMLNDYLRDPYIRQSEVEATREWLARQFPRA